MEIVDPRREDAPAGCLSIASRRWAVPCGGLCAGWPVDTRRAVAPLSLHLTARLLTAHRLILLSRSMQEGLGWGRGWSPLRKGWVPSGGSAEGRM